MSEHGPAPDNLTGSLLVAHPSLIDPNFRRTILFLSHHSAGDGAIGLVLNRPLQKTFGEAASDKSPGQLEEVGLYYGGPVSLDHVTIASLQWRTNPAAVAFQSFMGSVESIQISSEWKAGLRAFVGYAGWTRGQLESEIAQRSWIVIAPTRELIEMPRPENAWRDVMRHSGPHMRLLAEAPDDPELN